MILFIHVCLRRGKTENRKENYVRRNRCIPKQVVAFLEKGLEFLRPTGAIMVIKP